MKRGIIAGVLAISACIPSITNAETVNIEVECLDISSIRKGLSQYSETPIVIGQNVKLKLSYVMFANHKTQTWTLIGIDSENNVGCVLASGNGYITKSSGAI
jgi:hypothetical protein